MRPQMKLAAGLLFLVGAAGIVALPGATEAQIDNPPKCIYAANRDWLGICYGPTTRLCEGSSECPAPSGS